MADREEIPHAAAAPIGERPPRALIHHPHIRLHGKVDDAMLDTLLDGFAFAERKAGEGLLALGLCTLGGDADVARRIWTAGAMPEPIGKTTIICCSSTLRGWIGRRASLPRRRKVTRRKTRRSVNTRRRA